MEAKGSNNWHRRCHWHLLREKGYKSHDAISETIPARLEQILLNLRFPVCQVIYHPGAKVTLHVVERQAWYRYLLRESIIQSNLFIKAFVGSKCLKQCAIPSPMPIGVSYGTSGTSADVPGVGLNMASVSF